MTDMYVMVREELRNKIMDHIDYERKVTDEEVMNLIDDHLTSGRPVELLLLTLEDKKRLRRELFYSIRRLDILQDLIEDPTVTEIMVNGPDKIFTEIDGEIYPYYEGFSSMEKYESIIQQIVGESNRVVNTASPIVDCRLSNGDRINVVLPPVAVNGPILTIRKFPSEPITMTDLVQIGSVSSEVAEFLKKCVRAGFNIFISGGTGSGKTTFLNALSEYFQSWERVITIDDKESF